MRVNIRHRFRRSCVLRLTIKFVGNQVLWQGLSYLQLMIIIVSFLEAWNICECRMLIYFFDLITTFLYVHSCRAINGIVRHERCLVDLTRIWIKCPIAVWYWWVPGTHLWSIIVYVGVRSRVLQVEVASLVGRRQWRVNFDLNIDILQLCCKIVRIRLLVAAKFERFVLVLGGALRHRHVHEGVNRRATIDWHRIMYWLFKHTLRIKLRLPIGRRRHANWNVWPCWCQVVVALDLDRVDTLVLRYFGQL